MSSRSLRMILSKFCFRKRFDYNLTYMLTNLVLGEQSEKTVYKTEK